MVSRHFEIFFSNICRLLWKRMKRPRWTMTATSLKKCLNVPVPVVRIEICWCVQQSKQCYHFKIKESVQSHTTKVPSANKEEQECRVCDKRTFWTKMRAIHTNTKTHVHNGGHADICLKCIHRDTIYPMVPRIWFLVALPSTSLFACMCTISSFFASMRQREQELHSIW